MLFLISVAYPTFVSSCVLQQGKLSHAETTIRKLYGKEKVADVIYELRSGGEGSTEPDAGWLDLFNKRYRKGTLNNTYSCLDML